MQIDLPGKFVVSKENFYRKIGTKTRLILYCSMSSIASPTWTWDIFLCYRRSQKAVAARFKEKLTQYGLKVFMDIEPEAKAK